MKEKLLKKPLKDNSQRHYNVIPVKRFRKKFNGGIIIAPIKFNLKTKETARIIINIYAPFLSCAVYL